MTDELCDMLEVPSPDSLTQQLLDVAEVMILSLDADRRVTQISVDSAVGEGSTFHLAFRPAPNTTAR